MTEQDNTATDPAEQRSKDECFARVATVANDMIERHGKDFAMGALVLAARFIAEGKPLSSIGDNNTPAAH